MGRRGRYADESRAGQSRAGVAMGGCTWPGVRAAAPTCGGRDRGWPVAALARRRAALERAAGGAAVCGRAAGHLGGGRPALQLKDAPPLRGRDGTENTVTTIN